MLIDTDLDGVRGKMDTDDLRCVRGGHETADEKVEFTEYYLDDKLVHRSVHVIIKQSAGLGLVSAVFS